MSYHFNYILQEFKNNLAVFKQLLYNCEPMALWKPAPEKWCLLEVVCHLYDEEREDFRSRIDDIFNYPGKPLPPIDPPAWVEQRKYRQQNYDRVLEQFFLEREQSLIWLQGKINNISLATWDCVAPHSEMGEISAHSLLENWLGHDYLHIRQILNIKFSYWGHLSDNSLHYAG